MRVTSQLFQTSSLFLKSGQTNMKRMAEEQVTCNNRGQDRATISPQGKLLNMVQQLSDQKKSIAEQKRDLISRTMEDGGNMEAIKTQLDSYEEQLGEIDTQIAQITADFTARMAEQAQEKDKKSEQDKPVEQSQTEHLCNLACATDQLQNAQNISAIKDVVSGKARVKEAETDLEELEISRYESKGAEFNVKPIVARLRNDVSESRVEASELQNLARNISLVESRALHDASNMAENEQEPSGELDVQSDKLALSEEIIEEDQ